jgi:hypothetical protein
LRQVRPLRDRKKQSREYMIACRGRLSAAAIDARLSPKLSGAHV